MNYSLSYSKDLKAGIINYLLLQLSIAYTQHFRGKKSHPFVNAVNCRKFLQCKKS